jgi:hypothetical protein
MRGCRWRYLLDYFGDEDAESTSCGHCDRCEMTSPGGAGRLGSSLAGRGG